MNMLIKLISTALTVTCVTTGAYAQTFSFDGDDLDPGLEMMREDPDSYIVEDGSLLLVSSSTERYKTASNVLTLDITDSAADWTAEIVVHAELQTAVEALFLGVADDKDTVVAASIITGGDKYYGWGLDAQITKSLDEQAASFRQSIASLGCNVCGEDRMFPNFAETIEMPLTIQLVKQGRQYFTRVRTAAKDAEWVTTPKVSWLRSPTKMFLMARQIEAVTGETLFLIDQLKITAN